MRTPNKLTKLAVGDVNYRGHKEMEEVTAGGFKRQLYYVLAVSPWASRVPVSLCFVICKMGREERPIVCSRAEESFSNKLVT